VIALLPSSALSTPAPAPASIRKEKKDNNNEFDKK
jgi:hypothetical protein